MPKSKISLYFMGTDAFAATILDRLVGDPHFEILGVVVPPDKKVGRKQILTPCAVKVLAERVGLPLFYEPRDVLEREVDFLVVASYGRILLKEILDHPRYASLNVHGSLLPQYRGASPIQTAILNGDRVTGVCVMQMVERMDAGPVFSLSEVPIRADHTGGSLREEMAHFGAELVAQTMPGIVEGTIEPQAQDESRATYCPKIQRSSGAIDWANESADRIWYKLRAYTPWPGVYTMFKGKRLKVLSGKSVKSATEGSARGLVQSMERSIGVVAAEGVFELEQVQLEGKKPMSIGDFVRGYPDFVGSILGE